MLRNSVDAFRLGAGPCISDRGDISWLVTDVHPNDGETGEQISVERSEVESLLDLVLYVDSGGEAAVGKGNEVIFGFDIGGWLVGCT